MPFIFTQFYEVNFYVIGFENCQMDRCIPHAKRARISIEAALKPTEDVKTENVLLVESRKSFSKSKLSLLANLPSRGALLHVPAELKSNITIPKYLQTDERVNATAIVVKSDETNVLVRSLRNQNRKNNRMRKSKNSPSKKPLSKQAPRTPIVVCTVPPADNSVYSPRLRALRVSTPPPVHIV